MSLTTVDEASISDLNNVEQLRESYLCKEVKTQALPVPVKLDYKAAVTLSLPSERQKFNTVERTRPVVPNQRSTDPQGVREKLAGGPRVYWNLTKLINNIQ